MIRTVPVVLAVAMGLLGCSGDRGTGRATEPPEPTTGVPTTGVPSTAVTAFATDPPAPVPRGDSPTFGLEWEPDCRSQQVSRGRDGEVRSFPTFGPLGARPSVILTLPLAPLSSEAVVLDPDMVGEVAPVVTLSAARDGVLVAVVPNTSSDATSSVLALVGHDGQLRWTRCVDGWIEAALGSDRAPDVFVATRRVTRGGTAVHWRQLDASDGSKVADLEELDDYSVLSSAADRVLLGHLPEGYEIPQGLAVLDLDTGRIEPVPFLEGERGAVCSATSYELSPATGQVMFLRDGPVGLPAVGAVWTGTGWTDDAAARAAARPLDVSWSCSGELPVVVSIDSDGEIRWSSVGLETPMLSYGGVWTDGETVVVQACTAPDDGFCQHSLVGLDAATGTELWRKRGFRQTPIGVADGYVIAAPDDDADESGVGPGWVMFDAQSGLPVEGQVWTDGTAFYPGCCFEFEYVHVDRLGGVVATVNRTRVSLWYPSEVEPLGVSIDLL